MSEASLGAPVHDLAAGTVDTAPRASRRTKADRRSTTARDVVTAGCLLASPLLLLWPMRADLFADTGSIDPFLSTAVVQNGRDLVDRFGVTRQVSRAGFTVPGRVSNALFGDLGGYYVHHYLLVLVAIVPAFVLFARLRGRAAGAIASACVLASPVLAREWSNDYGMAAAVSYLLAAYCCLAMPTSTRRRLWLAAAGAFFAFALYSHAAASLLVLGALVALAITAVARKAARRDIVLGVAALGAGFVAASIVLSIASYALFGTADLWRPTWRTYWGANGNAAAVAAFHSSNWRWVLDTPHLVVPVLVAVLFSALAIRRPRAISTAEWFVWITLVVQYVLYTVVQFADRQTVLEFDYYFGLLFGAVVLVAASVVCELGRPLLSRDGWRWLPAVLVLAIPPLLSTLGLRIPMGLMTALAFAVIAIVVVLLLRRSSLVSATAAAVVVFVLAAYLITAGQSAGSQYRAGQARLPRPAYGRMFDGWSLGNRDAYAVASKLHHIVPKAAHSGIPVLSWVPRDWPYVVSLGAAQYGWSPHALRDLPVLQPADRARLRRERPDVVLVMSSRRADVTAGAKELLAAFPESRVYKRATLRHGGVTMYVDVVATGLAPLRDSSAAPTQQSVTLHPEAQPVG